MYSIRRKLSLSIIVSMVVVLSLTAVFLYYRVSSHVVDVFDNALFDKAQALISLTELDEEGLEFDALENVLDAAMSRAREAGVRIVCGDTKVVPRGQADRVYINTAGVGELKDDVAISSHNARPGDRVRV